ncbi:MAG: methyltransferase type 11, partial [Candidatus Taylorbacteria bacterium]|nr:methyltransferase type 11 [Candidatus Taylorbacteria bacterium]
NWNVVSIKKLSAISYILSGGFSRRSMYSPKLLPIIKLLDSVCNLLPWLFATRVIIVLEKK